MFTNLKTITLLMLLAGISLGVFASTLVAGDTTAPEPPAFDERVEAYRKAYGLTDLQADAVRTELVRHRQKVYDLLLELRRREEDRFRQIQEESESRIAEILEEANPGESGR